MNDARFVFGPLPSRRLGRSLGVDVIPRKLCTLDCIYCELGPTDKRGLKRKEYVPPGVLLPEIQKALLRGGIDTITFSGSGEPTLNSSLGHMIHEVRGMTDIPVAVITNGTLLSLKEVRRDLLEVDIVLPSFDAALVASFERINRPHPRLVLRTILEGLKQFRGEYPGAIWLEVFLVRGINDSDEDVSALKAAIDEIRPDRIQLNTVARPPACPSALPVDTKRLEEIKLILGGRCEIIAVPNNELRSTGEIRDAGAIASMVERRPMTAEDISLICGMPLEQTRAWLDSLERMGIIRSFVFQDGRYYQGKDKPDVHFQKA